VENDDQPDSTLVRRQLGRELRGEREGVGFTLERVGELMEMSKTTVGRYEKGQNQKVPRRIVEGFGKIYGLSEERIEELKVLAKQTATKSWWQGRSHLLTSGFNTYLGLESAVSQLRVYQSMVVPGLLQTAAYVKNIERPYFPNDTPEDVERRIELRLRRAAILTRRHSPVTAEFLVHESVLHTIVGPPATVMAPQMRHMADMSTLPNVTVRIVPFAAGFPWYGTPILPYIILDFPKDSRSFGMEPPVVYTENAIGTMFFEDVDDVKRYREIHESLRGAALGDNRSRDLLRQVARRYER
jgi:transcriptional regulator with XRE-family HTH domain